MTGFSSINDNNATEEFSLTEAPWSLVCILDTFPLYSSGLPLPLSLITSFKDFDISFGCNFTRFDNFFEGMLFA